MSTNKMNQGLREAVAWRDDTCRKCEARIEINEKLHERNVELGKERDAAQAENAKLREALWEVVYATTEDDPITAVQLVVRAALEAGE